MAFRPYQILGIILFDYWFGGLYLKKDGGQILSLHCCNAVLFNSQEHKQHDRYLRTTKNGSHMTRIIGNGLGERFGHAVRISLVDDFETAQCAATIQNALYVITSAHCINNIEQNKLIVTAAKRSIDMEQNRSVVLILIHPNYDPVKSLNNIALLKLNESFELSTGEVMPFTLGQPDFVNGTVTHSYITGYGLGKSGVYPRQFTSVDAHIVDLDTCKEIYQKLEKDVYENQICAGGIVGSGPCKGDEGAPLTLRVEYSDLTWKIYVVGILSEYRGCAVGIPDIYTQLETYISWIESHAGKQCDFNVFAYPDTIHSKKYLKSSAKPKARFSEDIANQICASYNQFLHSTKMQPPIRSPTTFWNDSRKALSRGDSHYCSNVEWNNCDGCLHFVRVKCQNDNHGLSARNTRQLSARIIGGSDAYPNQNPYQVRISFEEDSYVSPTACGGVIYNSMHVLTSADCVRSGITCKFTVIAGDHRVHKADTTEQFRQVVAIIMHEQFDRRNWWNHDIAILRLDRPFNFTNLVHSVLLATKEYPTADVYYTQLSGWGSLLAGGNRPEVLQTLEIPFIDDCNCRLYYSTKGKFPITLNKLCAGRFGHGFCNGESGNPLTVTDGGIKYLVGIASFTATCGISPGVATKVFAYRDWIAMRAGDQ